MTLQAMDEVDWKEGLPLEILSAVAGGCDELKAMRGVCHSWQQGFESSVSNITPKPGAPLLQSVNDLSSRFPGLTSLYLMKHEMGGASLGSFSGLRKLAKLTLMQTPEYQHPSQVQTPLENWWSDVDLEALQNLPSVTELVLNGHRVSGFQCLRGSQLRRLTMIYCTNLLEVDGLQTLPLTQLRLKNAPLLTDAGLASLQGMALTDLELFFCRKVKNAGLEVFRGMPLAKLNLSNCSRLVTDAGLAVFHGMPLRQLKLEDCEKLTPAGCARLLGSLPILSELQLDCHPDVAGVLDGCLAVGALLPFGISTMKEIGLWLKYSKQIVSVQLIAKGN